MNTPSQQEIDHAIEVLKQGGIIIYPTDTAFGIGCRIDNPTIVNKLFDLRRRPFSQAMPVLVASLEMANPYILPPSPTIVKLTEQFWPGGLTIVAPCRPDMVYPPIRGGTQKFGFRMPNHEATLALIRGVGIPILGPSANFHGLPTPFRLEDLDPELVKLVDYVLPGECTVREVSTVVDCSVEPYHIIRQGAVKLPSTL